MKLDELRKLTQGVPYPHSQEDIQLFYRHLQQMGMDPSLFYQELEMSSRFAQAHQDTSLPGTPMNLHSHTFYEILCCRNTCGAEYLVGTERYRLQKGDIVVVPPGVSHRPLLPEAMPEPYLRDVLWISMELVEKAQQMFPRDQLHRQNTGSLLRTAGTRWESLSQLIHACVRESAAQQPGWELVIVGNAISLMSQLKRAFLDVNTIPFPAEKPELLDRVLSYIEENLHRRITLDETARHFYISESTIRQTFHKKMGVSFYRCVTQRRLIAAKLKIADGKLLEDVSLQVGFCDYSAFYRAFRQEYGISPRQYRKLCENNDPTLY